MSTLAADVKRRTPVEISLSGFFFSLLLLILGAALCLSAVGLWLTHTSHGVPGGALTQLWVSVVLFVGGVFLVCCARRG
ncbi:hypothetical protein [Pacificoceanicola onchidii]|uniref:hypothetical protein n=1 Tax=Pacificoceanicola onchidii TaxID=2562685 RepID=UPI0010A5D968|nr:hypothetical protein [Pacificoceanicola onchidii]